MRSFFFQSRRTSRLHIGVTSMDMPRERAAILRQRDASEHYIFRSLLQRRLTPATFLSASNGERSLLRAAIRGSSRSIIRSGATSAADFTRYVPFFTAASEQRKGNEIAAVRPINYKKLRAIR